MAKNKINKVDVTKEAQKQFDNMADFIEGYQKSPTTIRKFKANFKKKLEQIKQQPYSCPESEEKPGTRRAFFDKFGVFLYKVVQKTIQIVTFYDTRTER